MKPESWIERPGGEANLMLLLFVGMMVLLVAGTIWSAHMEAAAYERVTGKHVSTMDALWLDLRVQEPAK